MDLKNKEVLLTRPYKVVYRDGERIVKVFTKEHGKANVFNEALCSLSSLWRAKISSLSWKNTRRT